MNTQLQAQVIFPDLPTEIELEGTNLLKLELAQPHTSVQCTDGTLWLTQQGDPDDHFLSTGDSFTPDHRGTVIVQGMPCGRARISPAVALAM